jgi:hypothetical protein
MSSVDEVEAPPMTPVYCNSPHCTVVVSDCIEDIDSSDAIRVDDDYYCDDCATFCDDCNEGYRPDGGWRSNQSYCDSCMENYFHCERCGDLTHNDDYHNVSNDAWCASCVSDAHYCESCDEYYEDPCRRCNGSEFLDNYSWKPEPDFFMQPNSLEAYSRYDLRALKLSNEMFYGLEIEVESRGNSIRNALSKMSEHFGPVAYFKSDGSLEEGFEIVTHPMSYEFAVSVDWTILNKLAGMGFRSWDTKTCGIHIHLSRKGFKDRSHLWRFAYLINTSQPQCVAIAGRTSDQWSTFVGQKEKAGKVILGKDYNPDRYTAVNLCNSETVEIRMFKGSLKPERVLADIQFVASIVEYTRDVTIPDITVGALTWDTYRIFVEENQDKYKHIHNLMVEKEV